MREGPAGRAVVAAAEPTDRAAPSPGGLNLAPRTRKDGLIVHFYFKEKTLCGLTIDDLTTRKDERWISDPDLALKEVNCTACLTRRAELQARRPTR